MMLTEYGVMFDTFECDKCKYKVEQPDMIQVMLG